MDFDKSDLEFELESVETITSVRNLTQTSSTEYTVYLNSSYSGSVVAKNIEFLPRVRSASVKDDR